MNWRYSIINNNDYKDFREQMNYTLRFPFRLAPGYEISGLGEPCEFMVDDLSWVFECKSGYYVLKVTGFDSEAACRDYLQRLCSGFNWLLLKRGVAVKVTLTFDKVTYASDPEAAARNLERSWGLPYKGPVDGLVNKNMPSVYPSHKNIRFAGVGSPNVIVTTPLSDVYAFLKEGIDIRKDNPSINDRRLQTALDLYSAYWYEHTDNAKLLTLVLALESLLTNPPRHEVVVELLGKWESEVESLKSKFKSNSDEYHALESLERELLFRKTESLRRQVRSLVLRSVEFLGHDKPYEIADRAVWVYDQRSTLVHEGFLSQPVLSKATSMAKSIVALVLEARYRGFDEAS